MDLSRCDPCREELTDVFSDLRAIFFQGKMLGIQQVQLQILEIPFVGMCTVGREDVVVLAPDDQGWRLVLAEVGLPCRLVGTLFW